LHPAGKRSSRPREVELQTFPYQIPNPGNEWKRGGVGKSTVSTNLAVALSMDGFEVGLLDADIHGPNISKMLGIESRLVVGSDGGMRPVEAFPNYEGHLHGLLHRKSG